MGNDRSSNASKSQGLDLEVTPEVLKFALHKQQVNRRTLTPELLAAAERRLNGFTMYPLFVGDQVTFTKAPQNGMYVEGGQGQLIARKPLRPLTHLPQQHNTRFEHLLTFKITNPLRGSVPKDALVAIPESYLAPTGVDPWSVHSYEPSEEQSVTFQASRGWGV